MSSSPPPPAAPSASASAASASHYFRSRITPMAHSSSNQASSTSTTTTTTTTATTPPTADDTATKKQKDTETKPLHDRFKRLLTRRESLSARRRLTLPQPNSVDFSSNDFLSLSSSSLLRDAYTQEFNSPSTSLLPLGSGGSRLLDGNNSYVEQLEKEIASFHNAETGLLFNSGFDANSGLFSCIPQRGDVVLYDEFVHASVHEGMRLSRAHTCTTTSALLAQTDAGAGVHKEAREAREARRGGGGCFAFKHNSLASFTALLAQHASRLRNDATRQVFVAVESVYSMDGDVAPLTSLLDILEGYLPLGNGHLIVDEAHSTGVYGSCGRGIVCALALERRIFARLHTFGKALASGGAIVLGSPELREYLVNYARSLIYTTSLGLPTLVSIKAVYGLMAKGKTVALQNHLWEMVEYLHTSLHRRLRRPERPRGPERPGGPEGDGDGGPEGDGGREDADADGGSGSAILKVNREKPQSPIFSLITPHPRVLAKICQEQGYMARPIVAPTVPEGTERVRVCLHAGNTRAQIDGLVGVLVTWLESFVPPLSTPMGPPSRTCKL